MTTWLVLLLVVMLAAMSLAILEKVDHIMASEQDLQNDLDAIKAGVAAAVAAAASQTAQIAQLTAQLAAGTPVSQAQLDALTAEADSIKAALSPAPVAPPASS